jgi:drug/metabolite transporter (DMT)-like permease
MTAAAVPSVPAVLPGIGFAMLGFLMFTFMDTLVKWLSASYPLSQVVFLNALFSLVPVAVVVVRAGGPAILRTARLPLHALRGLCALAATFGGFFAYSQMPLADAYAIIFTTPLMITALSVPLLGERVGWRRWSAIGLGFVGVMVMLRPGAGLLGPGAAGAFVSALASALSVILVRKLSATDSAAAILVYGNLCVTLGSGLVTLAAPVAVAPGDLLLFALCGCLGGSAFIAIVAAYRRAAAAIVAPFQYTQMVWGVLLGFVVWGDVPQPAVLLGAAIVVASGLFIIHREMRLAVPSDRPASQQPVSVAPTRAPAVAPIALGGDEAA